MTSHQIVSVFILGFFLSACGLNTKAPSDMVVQELGSEDKQLMLRHLGLHESADPPLQLSANKKKYVYGTGEAMLFSVTASQSSYVACYYELSDESVVKVFPNRFHPDSRIRAQEIKRFPNPRYFSMLAGESGKHETLLCLNAPESFENLLPWTNDDLVPLPIGQLEDVIAHYKDQAGDTLSFQTLKIEVK